MAKPFELATISGATLAKLDRIVDRLRSELPGIPTMRTRDLDLPEPAICEGFFDGGRFSVYYSGLKPDVAPRFFQRLQAEIDRARLPLTLTLGGQSICVNDNRAFKHRALAHFAAELGLSVRDIVTFGDSAQAGGNDETLVATENGNSVGPRGHANPRAHQTRLRFARGTADVLSHLDPRMVRAIATDFDGTLTMDGNAAIWPFAARQLARYINAGVPCAVITGRGPSVFELVLRPLLEAGADPERLKALRFSLFNGANYLSAAQSPLAPMLDGVMSDVRSGSRGLGGLV
ncbi:MAG: hypothetical protein H6729_17400 [Deltaproteobacteria bacterium]|nr:hypothetical protein [Deltaproteobacteria bacterium]